MGAGEPLRVSIYGRGLREKRSVQRQPARSTARRLYIEEPTIGPQNRDFGACRQALNRIGCGFRFRTQHSSISDHRAPNRLIRWFSQVRGDESDCTVRQINPIPTTASTQNS